MHFIVLGHDGTDDQAMARRMAVREDHLSGSRRMYEAGLWISSGALLDEHGAMVGSFVVCDFASRDELEQSWLNDEPYVVGDVWQRIEIHPIRLSPRALGEEAPA